MENQILELVQKIPYEKSDSSLKEINFVDTVNEKKVFEQYIKEKAWCDARDQLNVWRLGKIKKISGF